MLKKIKNFIFTPQFSIRNVILSILVGFLLSYIVLLSIYGAAGANHIVRSLFEQDFFDSVTTSRLVAKIAVLGLTGLAVGVGMKAGILNIGVSGQMTAGAVLGYILIRNSSYMQTHNSVTLFISFIVVVAVAVAMAMISGVLKAFFRVNEVISTIMLNWVAVYLAKKFANTSKGDAIMAGGEGKNVSPTWFVEGHEWAYAIVGIVLLIVIAVGVWLFLKKTSSGFKMIATGQNEDAAKYAGYNNKLQLVNAFMLSGLIAGVAGFVYFFLSYNSIPATEAPIQEGFIGIAVALQQCYLEFLMDLLMVF